MELFEALVISLVSATIISILSLTLYTIKIRSRKIEVFGPYLFKLDESGKPREIAEPIPPEVSEALNKLMQDKLIQAIQDKLVHDIQERFRIKWRDLIAIAVATFVTAFIVQLITFLYLL